MGTESFSSSSSFGNFNVEAIMGRVILIAIVVLFMAVLFVLLLHLYARLVWWRVGQQLQLQPHHHHRHQSPADSVTNARRQRRRFLFAQGQDPSGPAGLEPSILGSIAVVVFKSQDFEDGLECAVCLSELIDGDKARILPSCKHGFHVDCIDMWFQSHSTCPVCRNTVGSVVGTSEHEYVNGDHVGLSQDQNFGSGNVSDHHNSSQGQNLNHGFSTELPNFPTNVLVWGDQNQVNSTGTVDIEDGNNASSSNDHQSVAPPIDSNNLNRTQDGTALGIDIPANATLTENQSSTPSARFVEEDPKSPMFTRLRSLKRLLSRDKRGVVTSCSSNASNIV